MLAGLGPKLDAAQQTELMSYFPEKCFFHWDGKGEVPIGSAIVYNTAQVEKQTKAQVCDACRSKDDCPVRVRA